MSRDASPERTKLITETEETLFCIFIESQRLLIYFAVVLECDSPILEALFRTKIAQLSPKGRDFQERMYGAIVRHFQALYPSWGDEPFESSTLMWSPNWFRDRRWIHFYKQTLRGVRIESCGPGLLLRDINIFVVQQRIEIICAGQSHFPIMNQFFATLDRLNS